MNPNSRDFSRVRPSFQPRTSIFPRSVLYFPILRALLREISPFIFPTLPFLHSVNAFPIRASLILHALPHPYLPIYPLRPSSPPPSSPSPPISFSFLPTFPPPSPINARTRAPSRNTRVRVHPYAPIRQEVFVYCLHLFTNLPQSAVHQHIRCE